ncbi:MAG TPA: BTAD domain-containing putative transcriptional regulator [Streptosporangiaceae bacterium]|nr:BTAD domain-containing putative transcriptional regulator [Streptosporangiaceae bacterium]
MGLELRLLGDVEAWADEQRLDLGSPKQRLVFALLALDVNQTIGVDRLVDLAWPVPTRTAPHAVQVHISSLRAAFADVTGLDIETRGAGYALATDPMNIDVHRFRAWLAQARGAGDDRQRSCLLEQALQLWSGPVLGGAFAPELRERLCAGLEEARLGALEDLLDARLRLGHHHELIDELTGLATANPLRERLAGQLMLALYRDGRASDALGVFRRYREHLADELGLDAGAALQQLELAILRNDPAVLAPARPEPGGPLPAQLPSVVAGFVGREAALSELDTLLAPDAAAGITVVTGTAGVGKTALAVHWAHRHRGLFPDGQLYINLCGYASGGPVTPDRALAGFLRALGVPAEQVPADVTEAGALYRSLLADRRVLVVLDNAAGPDQVRPLLPGGAGCLTLVTSRDQLIGLTVREGARPLRLGVMPGTEACALLASLLGTGRTGADPAATKNLAALCGYLPLALRIAAAHLVRHPRQPVRQVAAELAEGNRLAMLAVDGDEECAVRAAFDLSYNTLKPATQRMFRLIGLHLGTDLSAASAAALAAVGGGQARQLLTELTTAHLADEQAPDRFTVHDLLRLYAASLAAGEESEADQQAARGRLCDFYVRTTDAAASLLFPQMQRLPLPPAVPAGEGITFTDHAAALGWLEAERPNLVATATWAASSGPHQAAAWLMADAMRGYFWRRGYAEDWLAMGHAALAAAQAGQEPRAMAAAHLSLAQAKRWLARHAAAIDHLARAQALAKQGGWRQGEAAALGSLANVYRDQGRLAESAAHHRQAREIYRETGGPAGEAVSLANLGNVLLDSGNPGEAIDCMAQGLAIYGRIDAPNGQAFMLNSLGCAYAVQGRQEQARDHFERALALHRETASRQGEADDLNTLAELHRDMGRYDQAGQLARSSLTLARDAGDRRVEADANNSLGSLGRLLADPTSALLHHEDALRLASEAGYRQGEAIALTGIAQTQADAGCHARARGTIGRALVITRQAGLRVLEAHAMTALAGIVLAEGKADQAARAAHKALAAHREIGCRLGEARTLLTLADAASNRGEPLRPYAEAALEIFDDIGAPEAQQARALLRTATASPVSG